MGLLKNGQPDCHLKSTVYALTFSFTISFSSLCLYMLDWDMIFILPILPDNASSMHAVFGLLMLCMHYPLHVR